MGLTERHWFENEELELTDRQLEEIVYENKKAYDNGYAKGFHDAKTEQDAMSWINVKDELPNENGSYLVVYKAFQYALISVKQFAKDLCSVDKYDFPNEHRPGWYEYDDEYGYIERDGITHWMPLPNLPEEGGEKEVASE